MTSLSERSLRDPELLERYELGARIAAGGFGDVFKAAQRSTGQEVAIKILRIRPEEEDEAVQEQIERFRRETQLCAALQHPNIVQLIDSGQARSGALFAVFELVRGNNLADLLAAEGALPPAEALHLMGQVLDALACAHAEGVIHRDLKPANILVADTGARRNGLVADFGLGTFAAGTRMGDLPRMTRRGEYLGTPAYSAPEQLLCEPASPASDLFAWGLILVECLTGKPVLDGPIPQVIHRQLGPDPVPIPASLLGPELARIVAAVTEKDAARREGCAEHVLVELQGVLPESLPAREEVDRSRTIRATRAVSELSRIWLVPLRRNPNFTGREELLEQLAASLRQRGRLAITALRGLGGVGKTQLALEYAYRHASEYELVAWLRAEEPETLAEDFAGIANALDLPERDTPSQQRKIDAVREWLERNDSWLLIFDNTPNPDAIRSFLPRTTTGHTLVTSRHQSWRELGTSVGVEELKLEEAVEFLLQRTGETDRAAAARLAEDLGRLPLALEGAAAYMETTGRSLKTYLPLLRDQQRVLLAAPRAAYYPATLAGAWEISFRHVEEETPEAADLLRLCAFLAPDDIPLELLRGGREHLPPSLAEAASDPLHFDACVAALRRYSLVKVEGDALGVHRLVQLVTRERLSEVAWSQWSERALRVAEACFPESGTSGDFQPEAGRLLPHALVALSRAQSQSSCAVHAGRLLRRTGSYLSARGSHEVGLQHLSRALRLGESASEPQESDQAMALRDLGLVRFALGDLEGARANLERAVAIHERLHGLGDFEVAHDLMRLAWVLHSEGDPEGVRICSERTLAILEEAVGPGHSASAMPLSTLSRALWELGRLEEAWGSANRAIEILSESELYHPLMCSCWYNLGQTQLDFGRLESAERCIARALEIGERAYGSDHPLMAVSMSARGAIQDRRGLLEDARSCFERSLANAERTCHRLHEDIAIGRSQLGDVLRRLGESEEALRKLRHAQGEMDRVCGQRSRFESHLEAAMAAFLVDQGELEEARGHAEGSLRALGGFYSPDHPYCIPALNLLAHIEQALGDVEYARGHAERALAVGAAAFGGAHPDLAETHAVLTGLAADRGDVEAEQLHLDRSRELRQSNREGPLTPRRTQPTSG